ncbi:glycosylphosphatidylinositol anchor biosynthesis [Diplodia seriata]
MRIVNALTTRTFFQPDEFFQSLEPAWQMAFGEQSGAWITWSETFVACRSGGLCFEANERSHLDMHFRTHVVASFDAVPFSSCGVLALSIVADRRYYGLWTFPPLRFVHFNIAKSLAVFYGTNRPDYYLTEGLPLLLTTALPFTVYGAQQAVHQRGVVDVLHMLRRQHESQALDGGSGNTTVGFLMPCHSTPWRSHLVYPDINAWALTCEPPIDVPLDRRASYLDEADEFYIDPGPVAWLGQHMESVGTIRGKGHVSKDKDEHKTHSSDPKRPWPKYLVFFQPLEAISMTTHAERATWSLGA